MCEIKTITHAELTRELLDKIICVKSVAWPYSYERQLEWIKDNINPCDVHVLLMKDEASVAYLNLIDIEFSIDGVLQRGYGIGNVCTSEKGMGYGRELMKQTGDFLTFNNISGVLLCKAPLVDFYKKINWILLDRDIRSFDFDLSNIEIMVYNVPQVIKNFKYLGRLF